MYLYIIILSNYFNDVYNINYYVNTKFLTLLILQRVEFNYIYNSQTVQMERTIYNIIKILDCDYIRLN